jgi:hypothetical protein
MLACARLDAYPPSLTYVRGPVSSSSRGHKQYDFAGQRRVHGISSDTCPLRAHDDEGDLDAQIPRQRDGVCTRSEETICCGIRR